MHKVRYRDPAGSIREGKWNDGTITASNQSYEIEDVGLLPPTNPSKIVCIGLNYRDHAEETDSDIPDRPLLFLKPPNALASPNSVISLPEEKERIDYEAELGVVIGKQARNISAEEAGEVIAGYTCVNDLSNREDQRQEQNWVRGKAFDNAAPVGPVVATPEHVPDDAAIELRQNGEVKQSSSMNNLIFSVPELIEEITTLMTLEEGDIIATGTTEGVGPINDGDLIEVEIEGVGTLRNEFVSGDFSGDTDHDFMPDQ